MSPPARVAPHVFVVFGATGDLSRRKILPALYALSRAGRLPDDAAIVGVTRDPATGDAGFRRLVTDALGGDREAAAWAERHCFFAATDPDDGLSGLRRRIETLERERRLPGNRVYYLSLPPAAFGPTVTRLGGAGLNRGPGWTRLVVEKPFGRDLATARALNELLHRWFGEEQIYRIDHYLGKETVQNLMVFRFANAMFENLWSRSHVDSVRITVDESLGVERRAGYYESAGALRDMIQSHLTQLLALVTMEVPAAVEAAAIRAEKLKVLRAVRPIGRDDAVFGQYAAGGTDAGPVPGYRDEPGVNPESRTETFVALRLFVDNWRWEGVPFYLRTGKRMPRRLTEIEIRFRRAPAWMFRGGGARAVDQNSLVLTLQPNESFCLYFAIKTPGDEYHIQQLPLHFHYAEAFAPLPDAYVTLLLDLLEGDQTLFVHADEVETSWAVYAPLLGGMRALHPYPAGSRGPAAADRLMEGTER